jgi:hypothetical protein
MLPEAVNVVDLLTAGEVRDGNILHGRGYHQVSEDTCTFGYFRNVELSTGGFIDIRTALEESERGFSVGEVYQKDGRRWVR